MKMTRMLQAMQLMKSKTETEAAVILHINHHLSQTQNMCVCAAMWACKSHLVHEWTTTYFSFSTTNGCDAKNQLELCRVTRMGQMLDMPPDSDLPNHTELSVGSRSRTHAHKPVLRTTSHINVLLFLVAVIISTYCVQVYFSVVQAMFCASFKR